MLCIETGRATSGRMFGQCVRGVEYIVRSIRCVLSNVKCQMRIYKAHSRKKTSNALMRVSTD